ncbi:multiheme c-type cytochrome [Flexibacterium corallicola]|uniref:multiheme c-type cytochrome n=1 Tax=Flexibacterium corallicola TaxID=3037259 RepID=UPI00286F027C|nr:multiheme c-type cytochrome [Pseudovibrio sp. M1P-2-3]
MLWDTVGLSWPFVQPTLAIHYIASLIFFPLVVLPFWLSHRDILKKNGRPFLRLSGRIIEVALVLLALSGAYLAFFGNRGNVLGQVAYWAHLVPAIPISFLVFFHAKRFSMLKVAAWVLPFLLALTALMAPAYSAVESGSLIKKETGKKLVSANFDAGSVSVLDRESGKILQETYVGGDVRRAALDEQRNIAGVTDYTGDRVVFVDLKNNRILSEFKTGYRPFGIVYDKANDLYWVSLFEAHKIIAVDPQKGIVQEETSEETPRGLALLSDGRLIVTHAMVGKVSILETAGGALKLLKTIALAQTQESDETVSQGLPRILDDIAVSPDEKEAWLPHVLWNFDHPFQFQSTVFPSVSVLSLERDQEKEVAERRKHLFKQINIVDTNNRTRIVSNPHDAEFSEDGKKVYVTLAGSEDLMVFDLTRRTALTAKKERRARRKGKINQGGAKVMQIFRHIPGNNPRGLVVSGQDIFVQNAMTLDLVKLKRGGEGPFARITLSEEARTPLVKTDPMDPELRRGKTLFNSANSDDAKQTPTAGDFWMSCQSCHVDGFNFTNGYLYRSTPIDKFKRSVIGHGNLKNMISGDFTGDYLRIMQKTQGGMGHDDRDGALPTNADEPSDILRKDMEALQAFVTSLGNLPLNASWVRLDDERKVLHEKEWVNSAACASCHSDMFEQWADSNHRLMGESNPYFMVVKSVAEQTEGKDFGKWCLGCHEPQEQFTEPKTTPQQGHMFEKGGASLFDALEKGKPDSDEGTGCLFCHRITRIEAALGKKAGTNASFTVNVKDREKYIFEDNDNGLLHWVGNRQINAKPEVHAKSYSQPFYKDSALCSTCHNEVAPGTGSIIVNTYGEWEKSSFNNPDDPSKNRTCISCHMMGDVQKIGENVPGISTDGGKVKDNVVTHQFTGANHHLVGLRNKKLSDMSIELLRTAARLESRIDENGQLVIRVNNVGAGHALPTGVADFRQLWLDVSVTDANGNIVLKDGQMDANGAVSADARMFQKVFGDKDGNPVGLKFWRYEKMLKDTKIPADGYRDEAFALPEGIAYPLKLDVKMMFRIYPQWVTDAVRQSYPELPNPEAVVMAELNETLERP